MDRDDNDLRSQNFQLAVDNDNRFRQSLRDFTLTKFDFDDHLQIQQQYDNLTAPEGLLGIQGQADNWIEEFSPRHSAIEFSSSAAESHSISRHNHVWSMATSSEPAETLLQFVNDDEMENDKTMDNFAEKVTCNDSSIVENIENHQAAPPDDLQNSLLGSNVLGLEKQDGGTLQKFEVENLVIESNSSLGEKLNCCGKILTEASITNNLESVTDVGATECLVDQFQSDDHDHDHRDEKQDGGTSQKFEVENLDIESNFSLDEKLNCCGKIITEACITTNLESVTNVGATECLVDQFQSDDHDDRDDWTRAKLLAYSNQGGPSDASINSVCTSGGNMNKGSFSKQVAEVHNEIGMNAQLGTIQVSNESKEMFQVHLESQVNQQLFEGHAIHMDINNCTDSSSFQLSPLSVAMLNKAPCDSSFPQHLNSLPQVVASQVTAVNIDSMITDKILTCTKELFSAAIGDEGVKGDYVEVGEEDVRDLTNKKGSTKDFAGEHSGSEALTSDGQEANKFLSDKSCSNLICSAIKLDQRISTLIKQEDMGSEVLTNGDEKVHMASSMAIDSCITDKPADGDVTEINNDISMVCDSCTAYKTATDDEISISDKLGIELGSLGHSAMKNSPAFINDEDIRTSCTTQGKSIHISGSDKVCEWNGNHPILGGPFKRDNTISSLNLCSTSSDNNSLVVMDKETSCSVAQPALVKDERLIVKSCSDKEVEGPASVDAPSDFAAGQQLKFLPYIAVNAEEKEVTPDASLPLSGCIENNITMSLEDCSRTLTSSELLVMPDAASCDSSTKNSLEENEANALHNSAKSNSRELAPRSKTESTNLTNPESGSKSSFAANCGSPTVISCNQPSQSGGDFQVEIFNQPVPSSGSPKNMDQIKGTLDYKIEHSMSEAGSTFTLEVQSVVNASQKDTGKDWKPLLKEHSPELPQKSVASQDNSISKANDEDKKTHAFESEGKKVDISKGEAKINSRERQAKGRGKKSSSKSLTSDRTIISKTQNEVIQQHPCPESSNTKSPSYLPIKSSNLPDLSFSSARLIHQPFTDLQQVQLRSQIFVYGSLIQGAPSDEAFMMSAFGGTDGGRNLWERSWRAAHARLSLDKSPINSLELPMRSSPGLIVTEEANNSKSSHCKDLNSPSGQNNNKVISSSVVDTPVSWPSPLWSKSSFDALTSSIQRDCNLQYNQSISPLYACQSSQGRHYMSNVAAWLPQSGQLPKYAFASPTSAPYSSIPVAETVQVTPVCQASTAQLIFPGDSLLSESPGNLSAAVVLPNETQQSIAAVAYTKNETTNQKSRRQKRVTAPQELRPTLPISQPQSEDALISALNERAPGASFPLPTHCTNAIASSPLVSASSESHFSSNFPIRGSADIQQRVLISDETLIKMEQAKLEAENASAQAALAVKYSQDVWTKLSAQREPGLAPEIKEKLASAAVAAAAAASVAKAAAEAAKLSSEAALQAKMMVDEALNAVQMGNFTQETEVSLDIGKLAKLTHVSILKGKDNMDSSSSALSATQEAARNKVNTASAATKRAENLDALFIAAKLAAIAVSQAGTVIALGDPLPFSICELVEAGPEDYWKAQHAKGSLKDANEGPCHSEREKVATVNRMSLGSEPSMQLDRNSEENTLRDASTDGLARNFSLERGHRTNIHKGSLVEIAATDDGLQGVWFPASVLDLKDGKAYACYKQAVSGEVQRKEWIPMEHHNDKAPRVRIAHPSTTAKYEGTRKRLRENLGKYAWEVGDMVDAWICESWWEGIITEKSLEDETKLTVHFPARGDSSIVRAWNLRPSLIWKDGQWLEWAQIRGRDTVEVHQGDTPIEKRQKRGQVEAESIPHMKLGTKLISNTENTTDFRKLEESSTLSENYKIFSAIENAKEEKAITHRVKCTGLHKEGLEVIIGVPKTGKRKKFMEVSKHYISDKGEIVDQGNGAMKFTKDLMPQASHICNNYSRVDIKGKSATNSRPKSLNSSRSQDVHAIRIGKGNLSSTISSIENVGENGLTSSQSPTAYGKEDVNSKKKPSPEADNFPSISGEAGFSIIESSVPSFPVIASAKTKPSAASEETSGKERDLLATDQTTGPKNKGSDDHAKKAMKVVEPRRSSRRIQPTSRLLEGLQSSLIMCKIPSASHDKGAKSMHRGISH